MHGMQEVTGSIPVISTRMKSTTRKRVVLFFVKAKRVRVSLSRESAVHGLQEGHRDYNSPVISTRNESATQKCVVLFCFICRSP